MPAPELVAAYARAIYRAHLDDGAIELRVGRPSPELDRLLAEQGVAEWGFVAAVNPGSRRLAEEANRRRTRALAEAIARRGWRSWPGEGIDPEGDWPEEPSFFVLGAPPAELAALAAEFGQAAIVAGERGGAPRLLFCDGSVAAG